MTAMLRPMATSLPWLSRAAARLRIFTLPAKLLSTNELSATCAVPPMWKVRMVSWVPGSPMDWAAITPTASPILTGVPRARSRP